MRSFFRANAIVLTLFLGFALPASARADGTTATCDVPVRTRVPDFSWLDDLSRALASGTPPSPLPVRKPVTVPEKPVVKRVVTPVPDPASADAGEFDLRDPLLSKLQRSAHAAAAACRKHPHTRQTICKKPRVSKYLCYQGVKDALKGAGLVPNTWSEEAAIDAHEAHTLEKKGFVNVLGRGFDSEHAPLGAVLVYSGGAKNCSLGRKSHGRACGHIEIKTKSNEYCSDYCKAIPADQYIDRTLVGIYVKE